MRLNATRANVISSARGLGNQLWDLAGSRPSLDLRFADSKSLVDAVSGQSLITFTRASDATFVNSQGVLTTASSNVPRFDHNPTTGESLGLLPEEQRSNLALHSESLTTAPNAVSNYTLTSATTTNPMGGATMFKLVANTGQGPAAANNSGFNLGSGISLANSTTHTQSIFVKAAEFSTVRLRSNATGQLFDFVLGQTPVPAGAITACSSVLFPGNIYRLSWTFTTTTTVPGNRGDFWSIRAASTGDGASGFFIWGAQLEAGAFATSYIPTTGTAATRSADVCSITGSAFSGFYRQDQGTVFAEGATVLPATGITHRPLSYFGNSGASDRWEQRYMSIGVGSRVYVNDDNVAQADFSFATPAAGQVVRMASAIAANNFGASVNGSAAQTDASGTLPTNDRMEIGTSVGQTNYLNGHIRRLTYWPQRLSNEVLQRITQ